LVNFGHSRIFLIFFQLQVHVFRVAAAAVFCNNSSNYVYIYIYIFFFLKKNLSAFLTAWRKFDRFLANFKFFVIFFWSILGTRGFFLIFLQLQVHVFRVAAAAAVAAAAVL
jgi:hypothetical protein